MSKKFGLAIDMSNSAFENNEAAEVARILRDLANQVLALGSTHYLHDLHDINGNKVGVAGLRGPNWDYLGHAESGQWVKIILEDKGASVGVEVNGVWPEDVARFLRSALKAVEAN